MVAAPRDEAGGAHDMFEAPDSPFLVPFDGSFRVAATPSVPPAIDGEQSREELARTGRRLRELQRRLIAADTRSVLLIFQGMDASGKDGTIRAVLRYIDPCAFRVHSFRGPTREERDHDFLWRITKRLPARGRIAVFNRSQYEDVLIARAEPDILAPAQRPSADDADGFWRRRLASIHDYEKHLAANGTAIVKFWLNVSREEQKRRFLSRLDEPGKLWKFDPGDLVTRSYWDRYMECYEAALNATSRHWAPWYAIPADDKPFLRAAVAGIVADALAALDPRYPRPGPAEREQLEKSRRSLLET